MNKIYSVFALLMTAVIVTACSKDISKVTESEWEFLELLYNSYA